MLQLTLQLQYRHLIFGKFLVDIVLRLIRNDFGCWRAKLLFVIVNHIGFRLRRLQWHAHEIDLVLGQSSVCSLSSVLSRLWRYHRCSLLLLVVILRRGSRLWWLVLMMGQRRLSIAVVEVRARSLAYDGRWGWGQLERAGRLGTVRVLVLQRRRTKRSRSRRCSSIAVPGCRELLVGCRRLIATRPLGTWVRDVGAAALTPHLVKRRRRHRMTVGPGSGNNRWRTGRRCPRRGRTVQEGRGRRRGRIGGPWIPATWPVPVRRRLLPGHLHGNRLTRSKVKYLFYSGLRFRFWCYGTKTFGRGYGV